MKNEFFKFLEKKASFIRKETIKLHLKVPETRIASSLSCIEILVVLYYGNILDLKHDRIIISKGHGSISLYPILLDLGYLKLSYGENIGGKNSKFGSIPDINLPTINLINGSLGHGLGQGCGIALGLKMKKNNGFVFVLMGDGELYEGSIWESIMFASHHKIDKLIIIIDNNKISMLDYCEKIINLNPLSQKFKDFGFEVKIVNGHSPRELYETLILIKKNITKKPKILIANTIKGKGIPKLENDPLCHIKSLCKKDLEEFLDKQQ